MIHFKRRLIVSLLFMLPFMGLYAQKSSMTDEQVMEFVMKESEKGTSQSDIVNRLMERGVPVSQIQRIRRKYERERGKDQLGSKDISGQKRVEDRLRKQNANKKDGRYRNQDKRDGFKEYPAPKDGMEDYTDESDFLFPDSTAVFDDFFGLNEKKKGKQIFGHDIFNNKDLTFEPDMNIATPADYRLGPGDAVYVDVWGASQKSMSATVSPEGEIDIEGYGPVSVSGLTVEQANNRLRSTLGSRYGGSNVRLSVGQTRTITIHVMGAVVQPGTYTLSAFATVFHALYAAGGATEIGTLRDIKVYRHGKPVTTVDVYDYILNGNLKGNVRLTSDDVIIVGTYDCLVNVSGKVKRPMYYEMKKNESVSTLIQYAGGFTGDAFQGNVRLTRKSGNMYSVFSIDEFERGKFQVADGDSLYVDSVLNRYSNMVEVRGAVFRPGMYQVDGNITTVRQLIEQAGGLTEDAVKERGVMHRRKADRTLEVIPIDLGGILEHAVADVSLNNEDILYVPSRKDLIENRKLSIYGEVIYPGDYEYADNTTIEDLILQAGGLTDAASLVKVDVSRRIVSQEAETSVQEVAKTYSFNLKDGFVVKGQPGFVLQPYDEVYVRRSPGYTEQEHVTIEGEVAFTGEYAIMQKNFRLSDLIQAAGGLNKEAYPQGAVLKRRLTEDDKVKQQAMIKAVTNNDSVDISKLNMSEITTIGINLDQAMENPGSERWDIVLKDGDRITVPQFNNTVSINGEVLYPNTIAYKKGAKLSYYINQAGGYSNKAKKSRVFVVNMNGTVSRVKSADDIQPGCGIVVPSKGVRRGASLAEILSMGSLTATLAAVIATLVK